MHQFTNELWIGSEASAMRYLDYLKATADPQAMAKMQEDLRGSSEDDSEKHGHYLLSVHDSVGIISIKGSLITNADYWSRYYGLIGYNEIRDALIEAAQNPEIKNIVLDMDTPGGSANGVDNVSTIINKIRKEFKPVDAFTSGMMASAGYWIAAPAGKIHSTRMASVGSIGVISIHFDQTKMMDNIGIKPTVFRAGEFKALGNPYETLDKKTTQIIQARIDTLYGEFVNHIAVSRDVTVHTVLEKMAGGREFFGFEAMQVGMVDNITTLDDLVSKLISQNQKAGATSSNVRYKMEVDDMAKTTKVLTTQDVDLLAAGVPVDQLSDEPAAPADPEPAPEQPAAPEAAATSVTATMLSTGDSELVAFLRTELSTARGDNTKLAVENATLQAKIAELDSMSTQFRTMAEDIINGRSFAMRRGSVDLSKASLATIFEQYTQITNDFRKQFPVGGKAMHAVDADQPNHQPSHVASAAARASKI